MAVLIDFSNLIISNVAVFWSHRKDDDFRDMLQNTYTPQELKNGKLIIKDSIRQMFIASLGKYIKKFSKGHGNIYVCKDNKSNGGYWRHLPELGGFPAYKFSRKKPVTAEDPVPWDNLLPIAHEIIDEIQQNFPYGFIDVQHAEGDDIIAVLTKHFLAKGEKVKIVSEDKDMVQMQINEGVEQYRPIADIDLNLTPLEAKQHQDLLLLTGDKGDGIPSIIAPNDIFSILDENGKQKTRAPSITKKMKELIVSNFGDFDELIDTVIKPELRDLARIRIEENRKWIGLIDTTPDVLVKKILEQVDTKPIGTNDTLLSYLGSHKQCGYHFNNFETFTVGGDNNPFENAPTGDVSTDIEDFFDDL